MKTFSKSTLTKDTGRHKHGITGHGFGLYLNEDRHLARGLNPVGQKAQ